MVDCGIKSFAGIFEGLTHAKYLKKLNLNYNLVNIDDEDVQKVKECLKFNKSLTEIRMRFCGYN
jgi:hypothetical protein